MKVPVTAATGQLGTEIAKAIDKLKRMLKTVGWAGLSGVMGFILSQILNILKPIKNPGAIHNCADDGKCGYTTRKELAFAYAKMLTQCELNYQGVREGKADNLSHFLKAAGREHVSWPDYFASIKTNR